MKINYRFTFDNGTQKLFDVHLHSESMRIIPQDNQARPDWAELSNSRCQNCELDEDKERYCPIAVNIKEIIEFFKNYRSYEKVNVLVKTEERFYGKKTTLQRALGALMGVYMVASGCPSMEKLKPMVRFHLPFATVEETLYRSVSTYLLGQYFLKKHGRDADMELLELATFYREIQLVNSGIAERLRGVVSKDAVNNAVICLDMFAKELPYAIEDSLEELDELFRVYWE